MAIPGAAWISRISLSLVCLLVLGMDVIGCKKDSSRNSSPASSESSSTSTSPTDPTTPTVITGGAQVFSFNDLGMHCYDADFSVFAVLPPYNILRAQVLLKGLSPRFLDNTQVNLTYRAIADPTGSINRTSQNKTNFWTYAFQLFGVNLPVDVGLSGAAMPGTANIPQPLSLFDPLMHWFGADGIPITNWDDALTRNTLPLMRVSAALTATGEILSELDTVLPNADEMNCSNCHITGGVAADAATVARHNITAPWSTNANLGNQAKENILILHDAINSTGLAASTPILCSSCHYSLALDLTRQGPQGAQVGKPYLSRAIHSRHGKTINNTIPDATNPPIVTSGTIDACYNCHPGTITQCLRGAMATANLGCQDCHGGLLAVGAVYPLTSTGQPREPWKDLPKCQSCHTGDDVSHLGADLILRLAYNPADPAATPILATNKRFAESDTTLYRLSLGHHGVACEACHGSPHAEWPTRPGTNDNLTPTQIQGHTGPIIECTACHGQGQPLTINGPHGLHNVNNSDWNFEHSSFYRQNAANCQACHGVNLTGTVLSKVPVDRILQREDRQPVPVAAGTPISCTLCHGNPGGGG